MKRFPLRIIAIGSLAMFLSQTAMAADEKPKTIAGASASMLSNTCAGCHGTYGASNGPSIPTLAGMSSAYLVETMLGYKSGEIPSTIMGRLAKGYTDDEINLMGEYFAKQKFVAAKGQKVDADKAAKGAELHEKYCEKCHSESGMAAEDDSGFLKGQWKSYLAAQMMDYQNKDRKATKKMAKQLTKMHKKHGPSGIEELIEYYSSGE
ncbi:cytochrome c4 [uncultured Cocleimonas sp.]|uniref:c-type cytochrome n=1 Tax=uncultured Cocleimonas sp. TaxID=1051587 RepID=UPI00260A6BCA|nr:cytochrome c4 [uncultured Cocleimonas sp.]